MKPAVLTAVLTAVLAAVLALAGLAARAALLLAKQNGEQTLSVQLVVRESSYDD